MAIVNDRMLLENGATPVVKGPWPVVSSAMSTMKRRCGTLRTIAQGGARLVPAALAALSVAFAVSACGFRLMGSDPLPGVLARPYLSLKDPYTDFSREFEHQLKSSGATLQSLRANSTATIEVSMDLVEQRTLSVSALNIPTEYELTYTVTFAVLGTDSELLAPQTISLSKDYSFEETVLLAKEHEADILRRQMARDLVSIAMRRLTSLK